MTEQAHSDILVVGGGMVGSALALGLSRQGWNVGLVVGSGEGLNVGLPDGLAQSCTAPYCSFGAGDCCK